MAWIFLLIASVCEICWIYCLKYFKLKALLSFKFSLFFSSVDNLKLLIPGLGYVLFGVGNILFFSKAMKQIPASVAFASWMAVALVGVKLVDTFLLKESVSGISLLFIALILVGIIGLKIYP
ncbi:MAG TPA: SMR family transporter [Bacteroidia bacterium]|jgi:quaternary ammonium compound-resistance protein SugE|nr:SMR family transporter [Bacteroidia bacterium]